ncbi:MAG: OsmC family protein [Acidobacteria bacterium]|nr:OsmC family protein [Acidobacteriota bacterium]
MKELPHHYDARLTGGPSGYAEVRSAGLAVLPVAPPVEYDGPGDAWSPEHLLLASVQACYLFTLRAVARLSKVEFTHLEVDAAGTVDRQEGATRFVEIVLRPTLTVPAGLDRARVLTVLEKAKKACLVSASLSTPIRLEPEIREAPASVAAAAAR